MVLVRAVCWVCRRVSSVEVAVSGETRRGGQTACGSGNYSGLPAGSESGESFQTVPKDGESNTRSHDEWQCDVLGKPTSFHRLNGDLVGEGGREYEH